MRRAHSLDEPKWIPAGGLLHSTFSVGRPSCGRHALVGSGSVCQPAVRPFAHECTRRRCALRKGAVTERARSTENAPAPRIIRNVVIASTRRAYS